jgi:curli biogenesis system outer membrane secretion channel CsgG
MNRCTILGMLRRFAVLALVASAATPPLAAQVSGPTQKLRVAVMDLSGSALRMQTSMAGQPTQQGGFQQTNQTTVTIAIPPPAEFARGLTEMLTSVLVKTNRFTVLERAAMPQMDQELALSQQRTTRETAIQQGALLGANALITGDITGFTFNRSALGGKASNIVKGLGVAAERVSAEVIIDLRLVDATSGQIIASTKGTGKVSQTGVAADLLKGEKSYSSDATMTTPLGKASRQALTDAVNGLLQTMPAIRWSARVVDVRNGVVYLGATERDGMKPGLELEVYEIGEPLVDPGTGQSLGSPERFVGTVKIETVLEKFSTARLVTGEGVARGHIVRMSGTTP